MEGLVSVTGLGAASALGTGLAAHRAALWAGRSGIGRVERFDTATLSTHLGAMWPGWAGRVQPETSRNVDLVAGAAPFPLHELALIAAREAWSTSGAFAKPERVALVFGTCFGQGFSEFDALTRRIAAGLDVAGPLVTISTACASSGNAIGLGRDLLLRGDADVVIAGGADSLLREAFAGFSALGVLSPAPAAPFSEPPGTTLGEGAAFLVLERAEDAARRKANVWAAICGYGLSADGHHETTPHPAGDGIARAIRGALSDADWSAADVDFVSAHATGTANNDRIEWSVLERDLGSPGQPPRVAGSKGHLGHTQGASGALELLLALLCHKEGCAPPTLNFRGPRPGCPADPLAGDRPRPMQVSRGLKLSAAFGGANVALAYTCGPAPKRPRRTRRLVVLAGAGVVGAAGAGSLPDVLRLVAERNVGPCREVDLDALGVDGQRLDRSSRWLTAAAALALASEEKREAPDRTGLFVAATRMPAESARRCTDSIQRRGIGATNAAAFARMSVNAPTGACAKALGLLGPTSTFSIGEGSGLLALVLAADWLSLRDDASAMVAGSVDEPAGLVADEAEGAACLLLKRAVPASSSVIVVSGWAIEGRNRFGAAAQRALAVASRTRVDTVAIDGPAPVGRDLDASRLWGDAEATRSAAMVAAVASRLAAGTIESALLVATGSASTVAAVLERKAG